MIPLTITAHFGEPPVMASPVMLDAVLFDAAVAQLGRHAPGGWVEPRWIGRAAAGLPLARVETPHGWWYAASCLPRAGRQSLGHLHRRAPLDLYRDWTPMRSVDQRTGADKSLRIPIHTQFYLNAAVWTCVGDPEKIATLLSQVGGVGRLVTHGHGWIDRWEIEEGGPPVERYAVDVDLRPIPVDAGPALPKAAVRRMVPLRPPYHDRAAVVDCWQVVEV